MITGALPVAGSCGRVKSAPEGMGAANMRGYYSQVQSPEESWALLFPNAVRLPEVNPAGREALPPCCHVRRCTHRPGLESWEDPLCSPAQVEEKPVGRVREGVRYGTGLPQVKSGWARSRFKEEAKKAGTVMWQAMLLWGSDGASCGWSRGCRAWGCPGLGAFSFKENKEDDGERVIQG